MWVAPTRVRELKLETQETIMEEEEVAPTRVRELKLILTVVPKNGLRRTHTGA